FFFFLSLGQAETLPQVRGRVEGDFTFINSDLMAELNPLERQSAAHSTLVTGDGSFDFRDIAAGRYNLRLTTFRGEPICGQMVDLHSFTGDLTIRLPKRAAPRPFPATVSVRELQRPVPQKAFHAFVEAQHEEETGHRTEA